MQTGPHRLPRVAELTCLKNWLNDSFFTWTRMYEHWRPTINPLGSESLMTSRCIRPGIRCNIRPSLRITYTILHYLHYSNSHRQINLTHTNISKYSEWTQWHEAKSGRQTKPASCSNDSYSYKKLYTVLLHSAVPAIFPVVPNQIIAQMWWNGVWRGEHRLHDSLNIKVNWTSMSQRQTTICDYHSARCKQPNEDESSTSFLRVRLKIMTARRRALSRL